MIFWEQIFFVIWFFLPAGLANLVPIFAAHTPGLRNFEFPMDFYRTFRGRRLLGDNKTVRGLVVGILFGILAVFFQKEIYEHWAYLRAVSPIDYGAINLWLLGLLLGAGALVGDAVESFFKRQLDIAPGDSWLFFDQLDYVFGVILLTYWYVPLSLEQYLYMAGVWFVVHILITIVGYFLGLKQKPI
jgi:CDP-2,3-bis-(O-geranylgeranyl)-sn-glycerol synthase